MSILVKSKNAAVEVLKTNHSIIEAFLIKGLNPDVEEMLKEKKSKLTFLDRNEFNKRFVDAKQGVVLEITDFLYTDLNQALKERKEQPVYLMLDELSDPHNFGAILRSVDASGVDLVIIPKNRSVSLNETVLKVSTGALEHVKVAQVTNLNQTIDTLKKAGFWIVGTDASAEINYYDLDVNMPLCLIIGSEGMGMRKLVRENCDYLVKIPMVGHVNSLNASVSTGILLFDILRRKTKI